MTAERVSHPHGTCEDCDGYRHQLALVQEWKRNTMTVDWPYIACLAVPFIVCAAFAFVGLS